jgi:hypothetical protein
LKRVKVLESGVSPRVVRARVVGTAGSVVLSGPQIRARLGLRDTWFTFVQARTSVAGPRSARPASWGPRPVSPALEGSYTPAPRRRVLTLERRREHGWRAIGKVRTTKAGRYRVEIGSAGLYRVRSGRVAGPAVRVR